MLRNLNISTNGKRDSTGPRVGVLASEIPTGYQLQSFLFNDIDAAYPDRMYSVEILTQPSAGVLYLDKAGAGVFSGAPSGVYTGTQRVEKFDLGVGRVYSEQGTYSLTVGAVGATVTGVTVSPSEATISEFETLQFSAVVTGQNSPSQAVSWTTTLGTISATGLVTAPIATNPAQTGTVTAISAADGTKTGTATFTVGQLAASITSVIVSPTSITLIGGATRQFTATVSGVGNYSTSVSWSCNVGTISNTGLYTAPDALLSGIQVAVITAVSTVDDSQFGTALVFIDPMIIGVSTMRQLNMDVKPMAAIHLA